jgi:hypothetical protein
MGDKLYAKIALKDGAVQQTSDAPIPIDDIERDTYECVEVIEQPQGGLEIGDIVKTKDGQHFKDVTFRDSDPSVKSEDGW